MGFAEHMQKSLQYNRSQRKKKVYFNHVAFNEKTNGAVSIENDSLKIKTDNQFYLDQLKSGKIKGLIIGAVGGLIVFYFFMKLFFT